MEDSCERRRPWQSNEFPVLTDYPLFGRRAARAPPPKPPKLRALDISGDKEEEEHNTQKKEVVRTLGQTIGTAGRKPRIFSSQTRQFLFAFRSLFVTVSATRACSETKPTTPTEAQRFGHHGEITRETKGKQRPARDRGRIELILDEKAWEHSVIIAVTTPRGQYHCRLFTPPHSRPAPIRRTLR